MITILERDASYPSRNLGAACVGERLLRLGEAPSFSPGLTISCAWSEQPQVILRSLDRSESLAFQSFEQGIQCRIAPDALWIVLRLPWGSAWPSLPLDAAPLVFVSSLQMWRHDVWYDHVMLYAQRGRVISCLAPGVVGRLKVDPAEKAPKDLFEDWWAREAPQAWKQSLVRALRLRHGWAGAAMQIEVKSWTVRTAALLLILRATYPERLIGLAADTPPPDVAWKRLCQNLDLDLIGSARGSPVQLLDDLWPVGDDQQLNTVLFSLQKQIPFVPAKLLAGWL